MRAIWRLLRDRSLIMSRGATKREGVYPYKKKERGGGKGFSRVEGGGGTKCFWVGGRRKNLMPFNGGGGGRKKFYSVLTHDFSPFVVPPPP